VPHPDPITYVGDPSPEIDRAWEELTWGMHSYTFSNLDVLIQRQDGTFSLQRKKQSPLSLMPLATSNNSGVQREGDM
jgi:hypothetical protein